MPNAFNKEEVVAFDQILEGFNDALVLSRTVNKYNTDSTTMERASDTIWRPMPYIATSIDATVGVSISAQYKDAVQLAVPSTLGFHKSSPWKMNAKELRDALQNERFGEAAKQKMASDVNVALMNLAATQGTLFVKRTAAASGFDDVAQCEAIMNEQGVNSADRYLALSTRDYNGAASNLAGRQNVTDLPKSAYQRAYVGPIASFDTYKLDYANRKTAAAGGAITMSTLDGANNFYNPRATSVTVGGKINVDNRYQTITVSSTAGVAAGDAFSVAALESVHAITKIATGQLKTFRVMSVPSGTTLVISPPMITNQVADGAAEQYKNCNINTKSATSAITWLNTATAYVNPFWHRDAYELLPGRFAVPTDQGVAVMRGSTDQGIELVMQKFYDINTMTSSYRLDMLFGVVCTQPEMAGVIMFSQP
jgi:hypothetical protein